MSKHYTRNENGLPIEVLRSLPRSIARLSDGAVCWTPEAIEAQGRLPEYGYDVFDSKPTALGAHDTEEKITLADVKMVEGKPTATHRKRPPAQLELRRKLHAEGSALLLRSDWTQTADYVRRHPVKAGRFDDWRHGVRTTVNALKAGTADPFATTYDDPPDDLEDSIP